MGEEEQPRQRCASSALSEGGAPFSILWLYGKVAGFHQHRPLQRRETR